MNGDGRLEELLAIVLRYGTWLSSAAIGLGCVLDLIGSHPRMRLATMGIVLLIVLPILRVLLMLVVFISQRDFRLASIAGLVFVIILLAIVLGFPAASIAG